MNELIVPPAPHWYKGAVLACAPDNTLVYGSKNDLVVLQEKTPEKPPEVRLINGAHFKHVTSVSLNKKWGEPHCYAASLGEDNVVKVWNLKTLEKVASNKDHTEHKEGVVGAVFAGDDRVVSASTHGLIIVWNIHTNESKPLKDLFKSKVTLSCLSSCPHVGWLLAFGTSTGGVVIADLRRNGQVLYKLKGHYQSVLSLSWCPAPVNIFPKHPNNTVKNKSSESSLNESVADTKVTKTNPWVNLKHADDSEGEASEVLESEVDDFLRECDKLKAKILGLEEAKKVTQESKEQDKEVKQDNEKEKNENADGKFKEESQKENDEEEKEHDTKEVPESRSIPTVFDPSDADFLNDSGIETIPSTPKAEKPSISRLEEPVEEEPRAEYLLASIGSDKSVYVWRAGTDGRMQTFFHVVKKNQRRGDKRSSKNNWIALCWPTPNTILTSTANGEILSWHLPKTSSETQYKVVNCDHTSNIFNLVTAPNYPTASNWRDKQKINIWSWSHDSRLMNFDLDTLQVRYSFTTVPALVTCFSSSSLDPNRLAIGFRDGGLNIWDLSVPHTNILIMQKYQQKFTHKVCTIQWHLSKENILAFGTEEGRVGFFDTHSKKATLFPNFFNSEIYKVEWGPIPQSETSGIYVVSEGKIMIYDMEHPTKDPKLVELPQKMFAYQFAWKPDFSLLLVNGKDGALFFLNPDFTVITTVYPNEKGLNMIQWHPDATTSKTEISERCNWFAATTTKGIFVFDCTKIRENENFTEQIVANLEGHIKPTLAVAWCPLKGDCLASSSTDGLVHIWDVSLKIAIATFVDPYFSHNAALLWSPADPDLIIMGDKLLRIWKISGNAPQSDPEFLAERKKQLSKLVKYSDSSKVDKIKTKVNVSIKSKTTPKNCIVPALYVSNDENIGLQVENMKKLLQGELDIADALQIFGTKEQVTNLLDTNYNQQKKEGHQKSCEMISLWKGNMGEYVRNAINENRVTPSVITLAPMVSPVLWQEACYAYAKKISEEANCDPLEAATYFLACHKVEEAIKCLCDNLMFKEALALAKFRLLSNSDITKDVLEKWALHCVNTGNFENAAYCYISIQDYENAAMVLGRRTHKEFLDFALELAEKTENKSLYSALKLKAETSSLEDEDKENLPSRATATLMKMEVAAKNGQVSSEEED